MESTESAVPQVPPAGEQDEHSRTRLLHAAVKVFDRKGYAAASVREIAEMAGVTKPAVYYHFGSKEGLLLAILMKATHELETTMAKAVSRPGTARQRILGLCEDVYGLFGEHVPLARVAHAVLLGPPDGAPPFDVKAVEALLLGALEKLASEGAASGEFRPGIVRDIAMAVMGILEGCNERQLHPAFEPIGVDGMRRLLNLLFDGATGAPRG